MEQEVINSSSLSLLSSDDDELLLSSSSSSSVSSSSNCGPSLLPDESNMVVDAISMIAGMVTKVKRIMIPLLEIMM